MTPINLICLFFFLTLLLRNLWFLDDAEKEYNAMEVELGAGFKPGDIFWALANRQTLELELNPGKNAKEISQIYFTMARHLLDEGKSKAHVQQLQAGSAYWNLVHHQIQFASMELGANAVVKTDTCCDECSKLEGKEYDLDELVANCLVDQAEGRPETSSCPLPQASCELQWCTCHFTVKSDSAKKSRVLFSPVDSEEGGAEQAGCLIQIIILVVLGVFLIIISSIFSFVAGLVITVPLYLFLTVWAKTVNLE